MRRSGLLVAVAAAIMGAAGPSQAQSLAGKAKAVADATALVNAVKQRQHEILSTTAHMPHLSQRKLGSGEIVLAFRAEALPSIFKTGIKNLHATGTSNGDQMPAKRLAVESLISGRNFQDRDLTSDDLNLLPKYAFVTFQDHGEVKAEAYGSIMFVLKPRVKSRATWTPFDSFNLVERGPVLPDTETFSRGLLNTFSEAVEPVQNGTYFEAQVWGPLDITDVNEVIVQSYGFANPHADTTLEEIRALRKLLRSNIKISTFAPERRTWVGPMTDLNKRVQMSLSERAEIDAKLARREPYARSRYPVKHLGEDLFCRRAFE